MDNRKCNEQGHAYYKTGSQDMHRKCMTCGKEQVRAQGGPWVDAPKPPRVAREQKVVEGQESLWNN